MGLARTTLLAGVIRASVPFDACHEIAHATRKHICKQRRSLNITCQQREAWFFLLLKKLKVTAKTVAEAVGSWMTVENGIEMYAHWKNQVQECGKTG